MDRFVAVLFLVTDANDDGAVFPPIIGRQLLQELGVCPCLCLARHLFTLCCADLCMDTPRGAYSRVRTVVRSVRLVLLV